MKFFVLLLDLTAVIIQGALFLFFSLAITFGIYLATDYLINPYLIVGLVAIYFLFCKDGIIETIKNRNKY